MVSSFAALNSPTVSGGQTPAGKTQVAVLLNYDTYYPSMDMEQMHSTLEETLSWLKTEGFPMSKVMIVTWLNTFEDINELNWLVATLEKYGVATQAGQFGLFVAPQDAQSATILHNSLATFNDKMGRYPYFVAGFSASQKTYTQLVNQGVKLSLFNLWEEGEDYSYRGYSTNDNLTGANWEGSPFQPYKPSKRTANAPGLTDEDELDIWEAHWITRNPSYAYLAVNSRNWGSIHPNDLLQGDKDGSQSVSSSEALRKFKTILDLIDFNADYNEMMHVSYPVEVTYLTKQKVFEVWQNSMREFISRGYKFVDAVELRDNLESLRAETPHTPTSIWYDDMTSSDVVIRGENTPFAMVSSPYGRFIYARRDPLNDSGAPLVSVVSYTTARAFNGSFQSIRELAGSDSFKMNTLVNGEPIEMRWPGDIQSVTITRGKAIVIRWAYVKDNVPYVEYDVTTYLTPYGVLLEKDLAFKQSVEAAVSVVHHFNVQESSPTAVSDSDVRLETDEVDSFTFLSTNPTSVELWCEVNDTLTFKARDGYTLAVTLTSAEPDVIKAFDEAGASPYETLEFEYFQREYFSGDKLHLSYALTPAKDIQNARQLASQVTEIAENADGQEVPEQSEQPIPSYVALLLVAVVLVSASALLLKRFRKGAGKK